jgi:hypothetical protein
MVFPDIVEHLDSEKVLVQTAPPDDAGTEDWCSRFVVTMPFHPERAR